MGEWNNESMIQWMHVKNDWINGSMNEWMNEWMKEGMNECMNEWTNEGKEEGRNEGRNGRMKMNTFFQKVMKERNDK